jgi:hypothetical protein
MIGSIFAQHAPLIRDYPNAPPPPPAPPAPPTPPQPPQAEPIAFSAVTRASLFGVIGSAISSTTLATITCADAAMTIRQSEVVAGLTFSYSAGVLTIAGTATGSTRVQRVVVSYIASDGSNTVRGSTSHEITLVKASEVLTIGSMAGAAGKVGRPLAATLASPSANYLVGVTAHPGALVPGCEATLAWTEASPTSSGTLTLAGTPTLAGTYSLTVNYRNGLVSLGTSTHAVVIAAAYEAPAPAPSPTPAPPAPSPSPPPVPSPAPAPGLGPDPHLAGVRVLMRFNTATGIAYDERGNTFANNGGTLTTGAVAQGAFLPTRGTISGSVPTLDATATGLAVDCMVDISAATWADLTASGDAVRYCPVVSYISAANSTVWTLGFISYKILARRVVQPIFMNVGTGASYGRRFTYSLGLSATMPTRPNRFVHLCGARQYVSSVSSIFSVWLDGVATSGTQTVDAALLAAATGTLQIGGVCPAVDPRVNNSVTVIVPFSGVVDELRVTTGARYAEYIDMPNNSTLPTSARVIPWPNY